MKSLAEFLVHAIALEEESADRFDELADAVAVHHNTEVAELFRKMAHFSRLHLAEVQQAAEGLELPHIAPWDMRWPDNESPETVGHDDAHYLMTPHHALKAALVSEQHGFAFYNDLAQDSDDAEIRRLAKEFADEEAQHVALLEEWLLKYPPPDQGWDEDLDPPVVVD